MASERASIVDKWLEDDNLMLIECWARDGCTESDIAHRIGINPSTLNAWKSRYEPIKQALASGKEIIDYKVENALLKRALGYKTKEIKVVLGRQVKNGQVFQLTKEVVEKEIAPDVTACAMWLNNRRPDKWKKNRDKSIEMEEEDESIQITVVRGPKAEEQNDNINQSVTLSKKQGNTPKTAKSNEKGNTISNKAQDSTDKDYWPDDWEDED